MAVSQHNFLPAIFVIIGLGLFAFFGFSNQHVAEVAPPRNDPISQRDEEAIDEIARQAAEADVGEEEAAEAPVDDGEQTLKESFKETPVDSPPGEKVISDAESERLNLSGQTVDDSLTRAADGKFDITFDHIKFDIPEDEPYSPSMLTEQVRRLDGEDVKLRGYIRPSFKQRGLKNFIFVRDDKECCFGPGAALFDCVVVKLAKDQTTDYTVRPVAVTGKFVLKEYKGPDGNVWAIYRIKDAAVGQ